MEDEIVASKNWFVEAIDSFREEFGDREEIKEKKYNFAENFSFPCQILSLCLKSKRDVNYQISLVTHNEKLEDKIVEVFGYYSIDDENDTRRLEELLHGKVLEQFIEDKNEINKYIQSIEAKVTAGYKRFSQEEKAKICNCSIIHKLDYVMVSIGKISDILLKDFVKNVESQLVGFPINFKPPVYETGLGGFIFPSIWIGEVPKQSYQEKLKSKILVEYIQQPFEFNYKKRRIIVSQDGYVYFSIKTRASASLLEIFKKRLIGLSDINEIYGLFLIHGLKIFSADLTNFSDASFIPETKQISEGYRGFSNSEKIYKQRFESMNLEEFKKNRQIVSSNTFRDIFKLASFIASSKKKIHKNFLKLSKTLIQAHTNLNNGLLLESFVLSWTIAEHFLDFIWNNNILSKSKIKGKRKKKLEDYRSFTSSIKLEILELKGILKQLDYQVLDDFRKTRNDAIHKLKDVKYEEAFSILQVSKNILKLMLETIISDKDTKEEIKQIYKKYF